MTEFHFDTTWGSKEISIKDNFHCIAIPRMTSQILKSVNFSNTYKPRYLGNKISFWLQIKDKFIKGYSVVKNSFVAEVTFK